MITTLDVRTGVGIVVDADRTVAAAVADPPAVTEGPGIDVDPETTVAVIRTLDVNPGVGTDVTAATTEAAAV